MDSKVIIIIILAILFSMSLVFWAYMAQKDKVAIGAFSSDALEKANLKQVGNASVYVDTNEEVIYILIRNVDCIQINK